MSDAAAMAAKRAARKAAGFCTECDTPAKKGHSLCGRHFKQQQDRLLRWNLKRALAGRCYCGERVKPGRNRCPACLKLEVKRGRQRMADLKGRRLCVVCGQRRAVKRKVRCLRCTAKAAVYYQNRKERKRLWLVRRGQPAARLFRA